MCARKFIPEICLRETSSESCWHRYIMTEARQAVHNVNGVAWHKRTIDAFER